MKKLISIITISAVIIFAGVKAVRAQADYFPLEIGNVWKHDVMIMGAEELVDRGEATWKIYAKQTIQTEEFYLCSLQATIQYLSTIDTNMVILIQEKENEIYLTQNQNSLTAFQKIGQHTYAGGETWEAAGKSIEVKAGGSYSSKAGEFNSCFVVLADGDTSAVYAPNVGPLRILLNISGINIHFFLKDYNVSVPSSIQTRRNRNISKIDAGMFTANNVTKTINFDIKDNRSAALSLFRPDGKLVKKYEIGGIGTIDVSESRIGSGQFFLMLDMEDGKAYTGRMSIQR